MYVFSSRLIRFVVVAGFVAAASWRVTVPGLHYDEVLFVNAALGGIDDSFIHARLFGIPFMMMEYIGALKAWLYAPVFARFGVSPATIRLPAVVISGAALYVYALLAERLFGRNLGLLFLVVLATDPALFLMSRFDWGPFVIMTLLKAATLLALFNWLQHPGARQLLWLLLLLILGTFDKLNFVWFVLGLVVSAVVVYPRAVWDAQQRSGLTGGIALLVASGVGGYVAWRIVLPLLRGYGTPDPTAREFSLDRIVAVWSLARGALDGNGLWGMLLRVQPPIRTLTSFSVAIGLLAVLPLLARGCPQPRGPAPGGTGRLAVFFAVLGCVILLAMAATPQASGPHHGVMLFVIPVFVAFAVFSRGIERAGRYGRRVMACGGAVCLALVAGQIWWITTYLERVGDLTSYQGWTDPAIYELARVLHDESSRSAHAIVSVDWGLHTQLSALADPERRSRYHDLWAVMNTKDVEARTLLEGHIMADWTDRRIVAVMHAPESTIMENARAAYLSLESRALRALAPPRMIYNAAGEPMYEVHTVTVHREAD